MNAHTTNASTNDLAIRLRKLDDLELLARVEELAEVEHRTTIEILHHLNEIERRRLYLERGYSSMREYCIRGLDYSSSAAHRRLQAARCIREHPGVLDLLEAHELDMCSISLIESLLDNDNRESILSRVRGKSYREVKRIVAEYRPVTMFPDRIEPVHVGSKAMLLVQFLADEDLMHRFEEVRSLLSNRKPGMTIADVLGAMINEYLERHSPEARQQRREERRTRAARVAPNEVSRRRETASGRHIPASVRDEVFVRDGGSCTYVASDGTRCASTRGLHIDHIQPYAAGGGNGPENLRLLCAAHNRFAAERSLGRHVMKRYWRRQ